MGRRLVRQITVNSFNEGAGTRTQDQRIKSPLLYRLSYALGYGLQQFDLLALWTLASWIELCSPIVVCRKNNPELVSPG